MWSKELEVSKEIAIVAGKAIMDIYNCFDFEIEYKKDDSPLTIADKKSNNIIVSKLHETFPNYAILSEEEKDDKDRLKNDYCFIVDPLDGTKEFIKKNGQFTVNIGLVYKHKVEMGVIYVPAMQKLYYAAKGQGSYETDLISNYTSKLKVNDYPDTKSISELSVVMSNSHDCKEMYDLIDKYGFTKTVKIGSSLKGCLIASGEADLYYRFNPTMEWDTAAMQCIVEEAGGIFRQMDDSEMVYNRENSLNDKGFYAICQEKYRLYM